MMLLSDTRGNVFDAFWWEQQHFRSHLLVLIDALCFVSSWALNFCVCIFSFEIPDSENQALFVWSIFWTFVVFWTRNERNKTRWTGEGTRIFGFRSGLVFSSWNWLRQMMHKSISTRKFLFIRGRQEPPRHDKVVGNNLWRLRKVWRKRWQSPETWLCVNCSFQPYAWSQKLLEMSAIDVAKRQICHEVLL